MEDIQRHLRRDRQAVRQARGRVMTHFMNEQVRDLAREIMQRQLKFADIVDGEYEMLSVDELSLIHEALCALMAATSC